MNNYNYIEEELDRAGEVSPVSPMVWYDTEQSRSSTKGILSDRISQLANNNTDMDTRLFVFNVRACDYQERMDLLVTGSQSACCKDLTRPQWPSCSCTHPPVTPSYYSPISL